MSEPTNQRVAVAVTGALGNLGTKLLRHLAAHPAIGHLIGLDLYVATSNQIEELQAIARSHHPERDQLRVEFIACDLSDWQDTRWRDAIDCADAVIHFAAENPYPEATWQNAAVSMDMTLHVAMAAADSKRCKRMVFATSNHVMGRYKDAPLADNVALGELTTALPPEVGTVWHTGQTAMDSTPYATAKLAGERICRAFAARSGGSTSYVCIRIGWCQPGENRPDTLSAAGTPTQSGEMAELKEDADLARADQWFKGMWLSNRDFTQIFERAILADASNWPQGFILVNGMSANTNMKWSLEPAKQYLGYQPQDNVWS
jgi:nucleoside-diphosphate-sugar epimerase